jgi:hypothetical protein
MAAQKHILSDFYAGVRVDAVKSQINSHLCQRHRICINAVKLRCDGCRISTFEN